MRRWPSHIRIPRFHRLSVGCLAFCRIMRSRTAGKPHAAVCAGDRAKPMLLSLLVLCPRVRTAGQRAVLAETTDRVAVARPVVKVLFTCCTVGSESFGVRSMQAWLTGDVRGVRNPPGAVGMYTLRRRGPYLSISEEVTSRWRACRCGSRGSKIKVWWLCHCTLDLQRANRNGPRLATVEGVGSQCQRRLPGVRSQEQGMTREGAIGTQRSACHQDGVRND